VRNVLKVLATTLALACGAAFSGGAQAMPLAPLSTAADNASPVEQVQYGCRRVWRCGPYGCGWRRVCWGPRVHYRPYYRPYVYPVYPRPYYYGGFYRPYGFYGYGPWGRRW
jgi:hypothetical protein